MQSNNLFLVIDKVADKNNDGEPINEKISQVIGNKKLSASTNRNS